MQIDELWMPCEEPCPEAYFSYVGGQVRNRAPQIAISNMRLAGRLEEPMRGVSYGEYVITSEGHVLAHNPHPTHVSTLTCATGAAAPCGPKTAISCAFISISMALWGHASLQEPHPLHRSSSTSG